MHKTGVVSTYGMEDLKRADRCAVLDRDLKPIMLAFLEGTTLDQMPNWGKAEQEGLSAEHLRCSTCIHPNGGYSKGANLVWFMKYANQLYESGISCLDLIKYLEEDLGVETEAKRRLTITLNFCFNKIKGEYRCEKMALFYLFDYLFFRSNKSLKNISFI